MDVYTPQKQQHVFCFVSKYQLLSNPRAENTIKVTILFTTLILLQPLSCLSTATAASDKQHVTSAVKQFMY